MHLTDRSILSNIFKDQCTLFGFGLLAISATVFFFSGRSSSFDWDSGILIFFILYAITVTYLISVASYNKEVFGGYFRFKSLIHNILLLQLLNISAYALNRFMSVFDLSVSWVILFLILSNGAIIYYALTKEHKPTWYNHLLVIVINFAIIFHIYQACYVIHLSALAVVSFWFFGIPLHAFVPMLYICAHVAVLRAFMNSSNIFWNSTLIAWSLAIFAIAFVTLRFAKINKTIAAQHHELHLPYQENTLPPWVTLSQQLPADWITDRALKCGLSYSDGGRLFRNNLTNLGTINEPKHHDPLVVIASFLAGKPDLPSQDRIKILNSLFDARHVTQSKLWSGKNLATSDIITNVQLYPSYRIAYTEKTLTIKNKSTSKWSRPEEALYTFYLPEGSVVTSASLWIEGQEQEAYMSTKDKANLAYTTIVGRERRDPLLLHWQEGNQVTVRVFPCTSTEDRLFKIGVTTPLHLDDDRLKYTNIDFKGPDWQFATESINIVSESELNQVITPFSFKKEGINYQYRGLYQSDWAISFNKSPISNQSFVFNNKSYHMSMPQTRHIDFEPHDIYLDINAGWSYSVCQRAWQINKNRSVYVYDNYRIIKVTEQNKNSLFEHLRKKNYTLFPFYNIAHPDRSLVVTKYHQDTPTLSDIKNSVFQSKSSEYFHDHSRQVIVFNIGHEMSSYIKSLNEFKCISYHQGTMDQLATALQNHEIEQWSASDNEVINQVAHVKISQVDAALQTNNLGAPDHLMRLYTYAQLMADIGKDFQHIDSLAPDLITQAKEANVVSPVSSLIVLETAKDYDRFDITKSKNSLGNASIGNNGAVPEPHEWALIALVLGLLFWLKTIA